MNWKKAAVAFAWVIAAALALAFTAVKIRNWGPQLDAPFQGDFIVYRNAARVLFQDPQRLYRTEDWPQVLNEPGTDWLPFLYMPAVGLAMTPFAAIPLDAARRVWFWLTAALQLIIVLLIARRMPPGVPRVVGLASLLLTPAMLDNFYQGQINLVMALLLTAAWYGVDDRRRWVRVLAGVCLGVACGIKPVMAGLALVALVRRRWIFLTGTAAGWLTLLAIGVLALPTSVTVDYFAVLGGAVGERVPNNISQGLLINQSIPAFWQKVLVGSGLEGVSGVLGMASVVIILLLAAASVARAGNAGKPIGAIEMSIGALAVLICVPLTWNHYLQAVAPAFVGIAVAWDRARASGSLTSQLAIPVGLLFIVAQRGAELLVNYVGWAGVFSMMTFGVLIWLTVLMKSNSCPDTR